MMEQYHYDPATGVRGVRQPLSAGTYQPQPEPADPLSVADVAGGLGHVDALGTPLDHGINPLTGTGEPPFGTAPFMPPIGPIPANIIIDRPADPGRGPDDVGTSGITEDPPWLAKANTTPFHQVSKERES